MQWFLLILFLLLLVVSVARLRAPLINWTVGIAVPLLLLPLFGLIGWGVASLFLFIFAIIFIPLHVDELRLRWITEPLFRHMKAALPPMSETERSAMEAGNVWWDAELFQGEPDWQKLLDTSASILNAEEEAFLDGPVEELCSMLDDWEITHKHQDLPPKVWAYIKSNRFFGMIIPKEYGGLGFSAYAHSQVIQKISSRSITAAVTVMVPNSLGPAELLLNYGTDRQKSDLLPRLATGEEVPCFALTGPEAGSDAGAIPDRGVVCKAEYQGKKVLGFRTSWEKRYITLGPVATTLGLAFHAYDPDHLLGEKEDLGITCALVPTDTKGVKIGRRHNPLDSAFQNGPNYGKDVFIPMEWIIGGQEQVGRGWRMLVERLAIGRGISLPSLSCGGAKMAAFTSGTYSRIRKQFHLPVGKFEGVEEPLARIGGMTYMMDAGRTLTLSALDHGEKPSVVTAMMKYYLTEGMRSIINDAMDIHGGRGICLGPSNYLGQAYQTIPVGITVEGANILTRTLIVFGQGAMRCHPYVMDEMDALSAKDEEEGIRTFDALLMKHLAYVMGNAARSFVYSVGLGRLAPTPTAGEVTSYYRELARFSASFATMADFSLLVLGGALKRKEKISGRFADALGYMYLCSATLKRFEDDGRPEADLPFVHWSCQYALYRIQEALYGIARNYPVPLIGLKLRALTFPLGRRLRMPSDKLGHRVAALLIGDDGSRERLSAGIYLPEDAGDIIGSLKHAFDLTLKADEVEKRLREAGQVYEPSEEYSQWLKRILSDSLINRDEHTLLSEARQAMRDVIMVDDFPAGRKRSAAK